VDDTEAEAHRKLTLEPAMPSCLRAINRYMASATLAVAATFGWWGGTAAQAAEAGSPDRPNAAQIAMASHRAIYDVDLAQMNASAGIAELSGRLVFELTGTACTQWRQTMRFVTRTVSTDGQVSISDMRSNFSEAGNGQTFKFNSENYRDKRLSEKATGSASRITGPKPELRVDLRRPKRKTLTFEESAMFPVQHTFALLRAARAGKRVFSTAVYDGSDAGDQVYATTAALGRRLETDYNQTLVPADNADALNGLTAWPVSLSYFPADARSSDAVPEYELAFVMFENGVSRRLFIDYGRFSVRGTLTNLEMLPTEPCAKADGK